MNIKTMEVNSESGRRVAAASLVGRKVFMSAALLVLLSAPITQSHAASVCKGLQNDACQSSSSCSWVETYTRKDGREVKSFCRTSSRAKPSAKSVKKKPLKEKSNLK